MHLESGREKGKKSKITTLMAKRMKLIKINGKIKGEQTINR